VPGSQRCSGWAGRISPRRSGSDRSILSEVNHRLESRMRNVAKLKMWPSGFKGLTLNTLVLDFAT
jgi:hypothetical protein